MSMVFILKNPEPQALRDWKAQESVVLETYYLSNDSNAAWAHFPSNKPRIALANIVNYSKFELKGELLNEQCFICAYCMDRLEQDHKCTIDHVVPKSINARLYTFDYNNLVAACSGSTVRVRDEKGRKINVKNRHCNNQKAEENILVSPLQEDCEEKFTYTEEGEIGGNDEDAINTIKVLGLDCSKLQIARRKAIRNVLYNDPPDDLVLISREQMSEQLTLLQSEENQKQPFFKAIEIVLLKYLP